MPNSLTNMDALFLSQLAGDFDLTDPDQAAIASRLSAIAQNLQSLDEKVQALSNDYARGLRDAEARMFRRSNILTNPPGEDETGRSILAQINQRVAQGNVKRVPLGERALEDKPHEFNGPRRKAAKPSPAIDLDLSFLRD